MSDPRIITKGTPEYEITKAFRDELGKNLKLMVRAGRKGLITQRDFAAQCSQSAYLLLSCVAQYDKPGALDLCRTFRKMIQTEIKPSEE